MNRQQVTRNHQQSKNETPLVSGILQRYAVSPEMDDVQSKDDHETQALINSAFSQDFSKVPITATQPQQFAGNNPAQKQQPSQKKASPEPDRRENSTGLSDNLKSGIENLSGYSMDDVKVHYNSDQPTKLQAHAYAQGTDIHVAPGQEKHLPHEAWHVVQQKQGRVKPTMQMKSGMKVNDDISLEREADQIGQELSQLQAPCIVQAVMQQKNSSSSDSIIQAVWKKSHDAGVVYWEPIIDGVIWFSDDSGLMWFEVTVEEEVRKGDVQHYRALAGKDHKKSWVEWNKISVEPSPKWQNWETYMNIAIGKAFESDRTANVSKTDDFDGSQIGEHAKL
jgi:hypothetical protein